MSENLDGLVMASSWWLIMCLLCALLVSAPVIGGHPRPRPKTIVTKPVQRKELPPADLTIDNALFLQKFKSYDKTILRDMLDAAKFAMSRYGPDVDWGYDQFTGPFPSSKGSKTWERQFITCHALESGNIQLSPTFLNDKDILNRDISQSYRKNNEMVFGDKWTNCHNDKWTLENNGKTVRVNILQQPQPPLRRSNFETTHYELFPFGKPVSLAARQFHFHYPTSEHVINGKKYDLEMQLYLDDPLRGAYDYFVPPKVVKSREGRKLDKKTPRVKGMAFVFEASLPENDRNEPFQKIIQHFSKIEQPGTIVEMECVNLMSLLGTAIDGPYFQYKGSLTAPPCLDVIEWRVFKTPIKVSREQYKAFEKIQTKKRENGKIVDGEYVTLENSAPAHKFDNSRFPKRRTYVWPASSKV